MSKEVQMTFRVEPELRAEFADAALLEGRPANDAISPAESRRRQAAVSFARASLSLEGFKPHKADDELYRQYVAGEINISDVIEAINESIRER